MEHDHVLAVRVDPIQRGAEVVQGVVVANHDQDVSGPDAKRLRREIVARLDVELIESGVRVGALLGRAFGRDENREEHEREAHAGNRGDVLREEIRHAERDRARA